MHSDLDLAALLPSVVAIARQAGELISDIYKHGNLDVQHKADTSPVTQADTQANELIVAALRKLTPEIFIVSEEVPDQPAERLQARQLWLVDPLDGTKAFVDHRPNFTVNIGLIENGEPILGVVYAPARQVMYYGARGQGAWRKTNDESRIALPLPSTDRTVPVVVVSHSHQNAETVAFLEQLGEHEQLPMSSSLKMCYVADGTVDIYPRLSPCMEWDTAAADAILRALDSPILQFDTHEPLAYNKPDLHNPSFIARLKPISL
ncbi:MAG TPA: 3'(2'),5'-bisphosphate nucleotidase CysQ [Candidatus Saccharimonadales bacterium]|nr:3'(2'),5'-bisphosphate nucleotidase CysQ [Candidatus Saccharimonadales bacterium]